MPEETADEAAVVEGLRVVPVKTLRQAADFLAGKVAVASRHIAIGKVFEAGSSYEADGCDFKGQARLRMPDNRARGEAA